MRTIAIDVAVCGLWLVLWACRTSVACEALNRIASQSLEPDHE